MEKAHVQAVVDRARHLRALTYALASFALASASYMWFGFDQVQTVGYSACAFITLLVLNRRAMFTPVDTSGQRGRR